MRRLSGILLFVLFSVCCFAQGDNIYYIDSRSGSDSHDGLSPDRAWKTFSIANNKEFKPGDRILLKCGSKWSGSLAPKGSGSDEAPITIASYGEGERPVIDGGGIVKAPVYLRNQSNWTIQGLEVTNPAPERGFVYRGGDTCRK